MIFICLIRSIKASLVNLTLHIRYKNDRNITFVITRFVFKLKNKNAPKSVFSDPAPPDSLVGWGGGYPLHPRRLRRLELGASVLRPPSTQNPGYASVALRPNFVALALQEAGLGTLAIEVWHWQKIQGQNLGRPENSPLTSIHWSTVTGVNYISRSKLLTYLQWAIMALWEYFEKKQDFITFYRNPLPYGMALALGLWPWPWWCLAQALALSVLALLTSLLKPIETFDIFYWRHPRTLNKNKWNV